MLASRWWHTIQHVDMLVRRVDGVEHVVGFGAGRQEVRLAHHPQNVRHDRRRAFCVKGAQAAAFGGETSCIFNKTRFVQCVQWMAIPSVASATSRRC
jgi:hypothetical protein